MIGAGPLVHADRCPEPPPVVRPYPNRFGDVVTYCPACCRTGIAPRPTSTPVRFREVPRPDHLDHLEDQ